MKSCAASVAIPNPTLFPCMVVNSSYILAKSSSSYITSHRPVRKNRGVGVAKALPGIQILRCPGVIPLALLGQMGRTPHMTLACAHDITPNEPAG